MTVASLAALRHAMARRKQPFPARRTRLYRHCRVWMVQPVWSTSPCRAAIVKVVKATGYTTNSYELRELRRNLLEPFREALPMPATDRRNQAVINLITLFNQKGYNV